MADYGRGTPSMGSGIAETGRLTIKQHRCMQDKMSLEGMTEAQAKQACGVREPRKKGGMVKAAKKPVARPNTKKVRAKIQSSSGNHKFSY